MINRLYGMLVDGPDPDQLYYRNSLQDYVDDKAVNVLIPASTEKAYRQFCADQLCRLCAEVLPSQLSELDPENSYAYPTTCVTQNATAAQGLPAGVNVTVFDKTIGYPFVIDTVAFRYDGIDTFIFGSRSFTWNNGTGMFEYNGFNIAFTGIAAGAFKGTLQLTRKPARPLTSLADTIAAYAETQWEPEFEPYRDATLLTQRIAAFTLNTMKRLIG